MTGSFKALVAASAVALSLTLSQITPPAQAVGAAEASSKASYRSEMIDGVKVAYREAGDPARPTVLLLHGFPTSSHMFRNLIPELAERYHVIAPDYPVFGASDMPSVDEFEYSFANLARVTTELLDRKGVDRYAAYVMDNRAPPTRIFLKALG